MPSTVCGTAPMQNFHVELGAVLALKSGRLRTSRPPPNPTSPSRTPAVAEQAMSLRHPAGRMVTPPAGLRDRFSAVYRSRSPERSVEQSPDLPGAPLPGMPSVLTSMKTCFGSTNAVHATLNSRHKMEWLELKMLTPFY